MGMSGRGERWRDGVLRAASLLVTFAVFAVLTACRSGSSPQGARLDPGVAWDIHGMGEVLSETTTEEYGDGLITVTEVLVVKVDVGDEGELLTRASDLLAARGWKVAGEQLPAWIQMESAHWPGIRISLSSVEFVLESTGSDAKVKQAVAEAMARAGPQALVVLDVYRTDP